MQSSKMRVYLTLGILIITAAGGGYLLGQSQSFSQEPLHINPEKDKKEIVPNPVPLNKTQVKGSFAPIVTKAKPAVVSIYALQVKEKQIPHSLFDDPFFNFFFGHQALGELPKQEVERSLGSGVIIDPEGIIVTCHHVVNNAKVIQVKLDDNRSFQAKVIVDDPHKDLAVIKIIHPPKDKSSLPFIPLGESWEAEVGDLVIAIGNPFGIGMTVTNGIVSALARSFNGQIMMQTDTPINPGNSGGALVDMKGNLIAIPNAILSRTGASHGVGFAIPSSMIRPLLLAAKGNGKIIYPWDGIKLKPMTQEMAESFGLKKPTGVLVISIHPQSPAIKAGIKPGDIVMKINDNPLESVEDYQITLQSTQAGSQNELVILRQGQQKSIKIDIVPPPENSDPEVKILAVQDPFSRIKVANLSPALIQRYNFPDLPNEGIVVVEAPSSKFEFIGIQVGDIIEELNDQKVADLKQLQPLTKQPLHKVTVRRGDSLIVIQAR